MADRSAPPRGASAEFYVGYLPMPPGLARFLCRAAPAALLVSAALAWVVARAQLDPGDAVWDSGAARDFVGRVVARPYPHLRLPRPDGGVETLMLVEIGKFGGGQRAAPLDGRTVRVSGWLLERDGRRMLEMVPSEPLQPADSEAQLAPAAVAALGRVTLRGEIVDSKCYLGAMKPGEGKTHKECATLCIAGGIPPMFVTRDAQGRRAYYLLTDASGNALDARLLPFVADAVELTGELELHDDLLRLRIDPAEIRRL